MRDMNKLIQEYHEMFRGSKEKQRREPFTAGDLIQIVEISEFDKNYDPIALVIKAMEAGFVAGYKRGVKDHRAKARRSSSRS